MLLIVSNENLRKELIEKGKEQRVKYNWDQTAEGLWSSVETIIEKKAESEEEL